MSLAQASIALHLAYLRRCGFCHLGRRASAGAPSRGENFYRTLHYAYCAFALAVTTVYLIQECIYAYQVRNDMDKLSRVMFLLLCHITSISKQIVFFTDSIRINEMISMFDERSFNQRGAGAVRELHRTARRAGGLLRAYSGTAVLTCTLWITFPVIYFVKRLPVEFPFYTNVDHSHTSMFVILLSYSYYVTTLVGIANTTMDAFMATILYQCKTQLQILRINFETLPERAIALKRQNPQETYESVLMKLLVESLEHYKLITETCNRLQDIFGSAILIQFGIGGWILCMAAYKLVSLNVLSIEFASMTLFITCILTELCLYCYYGNEVTVESERVVSSLYCMQWVDAPPRVKRSLVVCMQRAQRPLRPAAGRVVPLSLNTFVTILRSSYTFYAVLRQTK